MNQIDCKQAQNVWSRVMAAQANAQSTSANPPVQVNTFSSVNGVDVPYIIGERRAGDLATVYADPTKAEQVLGWHAKRTVADMCRDSWNWQKNNPNGYDA